MSNVKQFGRLRLSVQGTSNGSGFDILYDFEDCFDFVEFRSKQTFLFIQPWMQFPSERYSDECKLVSIELVRRFNEFPVLEREIERLKAINDQLIAKRNQITEDDK